MRKLLCAALCVLALLLPCAALGDYSMPVKDGDLSVYEGLDEDVKNILLIGTDTRDRRLNAGRADTMMICSINRRTGMIHVISLARDTWVTIGDHGHQNKLNAAHTFGGPNLLMQTINRTYHLNIEHYVTVNFYGICDIVDALGGVTLALEKDEPWAINTTVDASYGHEDVVRVPAGAAQARLCGAQALAFARIRNLDSDFGRQNRQRRLLLAMAGEVMDCSVPQMIALATTCFDYVSTNLSLPEILSLAVGVMRSGVRDIQMHAYPQEGEFVYDCTGGTSRVLIDPEDGIRKIHGMIYTDSIYDEVNAGQR